MTKYTRPDNTTQSASAYKSNIDNGFAVFERGTGGLFQVREQDTPDMTVRVEAGVLWDGPGNAPTAVAAASSGTITAPSTNPRIDRIVVDASSGAVSVITGSEAASPTAPTVTAGKIPLAQVTLQTSTTQITDSIITDERPAYFGDPSSGSGGISSVAADTSPQLGGNLDLNSFDIVDTNGNEFIEFTESASAVNHVNVVNSATGVDPIIQVAGGDTNAGIRIKGKGTGKVQLGDAELAIPDSDGTSGQVLQTNGSGVLSFTDAGGSWSLVAATTISNDATVEFTGLNEANANYKIVLEHVIPATDATNLYIQTSTDNGSSYDGGASDYVTQGQYHTNGGRNGVNSTNSVIDPLGGLTMGTSTGESVSGVIFMYNPQSTAGYKQFTINMAFRGSSTSYNSTDISAFRVSTTAVDAIKFSASSGNLSSGTIRVYKLSGS